MSNINDPYDEDHIHEHYRELLAKNDERWRRLIDNIEVREISEYGGITFARPILSKTILQDKIILTI